MCRQRWPREYCQHTVGRILGIECGTFPNFVSLVWWFEYQGVKVMISDIMIMMFWNKLFSGFTEMMQFLMFWFLGSVTILTLISFTCLERLPLSIRMTPLQVISSIILQYIHELIFSFPLCINKLIWEPKYNFFGWRRWGGWVYECDDGKSRG